MPEKFSLKDHLFNPPKIKKLSSNIKKAYPKFQHKKFEQEIIKKLPELELKQRITWISECLKKYLPSDFREATAILIKSLPAPCDPNKTDDDFGEFIYAPFGEFVSTYGCNKKDLNFSLGALKEITTRFSAEEAIRYFINAFPEKTLVKLKSWSKDSHYHVRRLVSEGTRPRLPWAPKIELSPNTSIALLDNLFSDNTRFVTRSVANHLNDISKINPNLVLKYLAKWKASKKQAPKEMEYIINHSLRTLVKQGNKQTMEFLGYSPSPKIKIDSLEIKNNKIKIGNPLEFSFNLTASKTEKLVIDYKIHFKQKSGKLGEKVYKLKKLNITKDETAAINKKHPLRANMSTRKLYKGEHLLEIQINGKSFEKQNFELT